MHRPERQCTLVVFDTQETATPQDHQVDHSARREAVADHTARREAVAGTTMLAGRPSFHEIDHHSLATARREAVAVVIYLALLAHRHPRPVQVDGDGAPENAP